MPALNRIKLKGFKSVQKADLKLKNLNILIGANGSGKSNFISLFELLNQIIRNNMGIFIPKSGGPDHFLHYGQKNTPEISICLHFDLNTYECKLIPTAEDKLIFSHERCFQEPNPCEEYPKNGHSETKLHEINRQQPGKAASIVISAFQDCKVYHLHDTGNLSKVKLAGQIHDNESLRPDASNLAAYLYYLRERENSYYNNIVDTIRMVTPFFDNFILRPSRLNPENIRLEWKEKGSDIYFNAHSLSDGTLRFMCLAALLLQPNLPSLILIDEPELGLHPYAIRLLSGLIKSAAAKTQVIISTQSVTLIDQFMTKDIIIADRENGQSVFKQLNEKELTEWLEDYSIGELWEKNVLGGP